MALHKVEGKLFTNQTVCFPVMSNKGNYYAVLFYVYDANTILSFPIKTALNISYCKHTTEYIPIYADAASVCMCTN